MAGVLCVWLFVPPKAKVLRRVYRCIKRQRWYGFVDAKRDLGVGTLEQLQSIEDEFEADGVYIVYQRHNDTVFVTTGWAHTVTNLLPNLKFAQEVASVQQLPDYCLMANKLGGILREVPDYMKFQIRVINFLNNHAIEWVNKA